MLAQQVLAVIIAIGGADHDVDVLLVGTVGVDVAEARGGLMVKLDQDHGTVDAVIENRIRGVAANPGEPRAVEVFADLDHLDLGMAFAGVADVFPNQVLELGALGGGHFRGGQAGVVEDDVILEGLADVVVAGLVGTEDGLGPLSLIKGVDEAQALFLLVLKDQGAFVLPRSGMDGFGTEETGRHHHLVAQDEVVDDQVVAVNLPAPGEYV